MKDEAQRELLKLWEELDMDGSNSVTLMELTQQYELSESFREYFKNLDIDLPFLHYAFAVMDPDGDGSCSFEEFAETVVHLKSTDPGPAVAFVRHQMKQVLADVSDIKHVLCETKSKSHEIDAAGARDPSAISATPGSSCKSHCHHPPKPEHVEGDQKIQNLQDTLQHEWEAAISEVMDDLTPRSRQPCNVVDQPPVSFLRTAELEKPLPAMKLPPWKGPVAPHVMQSTQENPLVAAEDLVEHGWCTYEGPTPLRDHVPLATSATSGTSSTSHCRHRPKNTKPKPVEGDQDTLHGGCFISDSWDQSRQPCNVAEQPHVSLLQNAVPEKHSLKSPPWRAVPVTQSRQEDPYDAAEDLIELLRYAYEGQRPMNLQHLRGLEYHFADLCERVELQLGRLLRLDPEARPQSRLELFACTARLMGALGTAMPDMLTSSLTACHQLSGQVQQSGYGNCGLGYLPVGRAYEL